MCSIALRSQSNGAVVGQCRDANTREPLEFVQVVLGEGTTGAVTNAEGMFSLTASMGSYALKATLIGYEPYLLAEVVLQPRDTVKLLLEMVPGSGAFQEVVVEAAPFKRGIDVPSSMRSLGANEIQRNPGSDNDVSKVIRTLPGVTATSAFRNDLIIRGGAPNENRFFLDDVEIPVINHLVTQGASGGAYSIINANQLREVEYMSAQFPANRGNALSSVFNFQLKEGNNDSLHVVARLGGTDMGIGLDGPIGKRVNYLATLRRSYRQYILKMLNFAFSPVYNDATLKVRIKLNPRNTITVLGIGAIDDFQLNTEVGNNEIQRYLLENLPFSDQSNYTAGAVYKSYRKHGFFMVTGSTSEFKNSAEKYYTNDSSIPENLLLKYNSREWSHRVRAEYTLTAEHFKWNTGISCEDIHGEFDVFTRIFNEYGPIEVRYFSPVGFQNYAAYTQLSKGWFNDRVTFTAGVRADGSNYNEKLKLPWEHLSGRANLSLQVVKGVSVQTGVANYFQLPSMMTLSYRNSGVLDNRERTEFVESVHYTAGVKWDTPIASRLNVEGFYKRYPNYLMSLRDSISIAHVPADFGVFGNYPVSFDSKGRAYGVEFLYQQRLYKGFYGMISYTLSWSEYLDKRNTYVASAWDARHVVSLTLGKRFGTQWEAGLNWRYQSAIPYTPFNDELSAQRLVWDINNAGVRDFDRLNALRGKSTSILNLRVDRIYNFTGWTLNVYIDLENVTADADSQQALILDRNPDSDGNPTGSGIIENPEAAIEQQRYRLKSIANAQGAFIPTFGFIVSW
ncbi:MAG: carboxypeptidase-like regulatory domain-containing protein [Flavobacteriales bacterium]